MLKFKRHNNAWRIYRQPTSWDSGGSPEINLPFLSPWLMSCMTFTSINLSFFISNRTRINWGTCGYGTSIKGSSILNYRPTWYSSSIYKKKKKVLILNFDCYQLQMQFTIILWLDRKKINCKKYFYNIKEDKILSWKRINDRKWSLHTKF